MTSYLIKLVSYFPVIVHIGQKRTVMKNTKHFNLDLVLVEPPPIQ